MSGYTAKKTDVDFKGDHLCDPCWNGCHYGKDYLGRRVLNCESRDSAGRPCDCKCVEKANEKHPKKSSDKSAQTVIDTGTDVIRIGPEPKWGKVR